MTDRRQHGGPDAVEGVQHPIIFIREGKNTPFDKLDRELARVYRFFGMIRLDIGDIPKARFPFVYQQFPDIAGILS